MSGWIKWEKDLETDPRVLRMVAALRRAHLGRDTSNACVTQEGYAGVPWLTIVCGGLVRFWSYADAHIRSDDTLDLGPAEIDEIVGIAGFAATLPDDWLVVLDTNRVELPGYQEHNGVGAKKRALNQKRQARHRSRKSVTRVTQERDWKRAEALPDQDQTRPDLHVLGVDAHEQFLAFQSKYPKFAGRQNWIIAEHHFRQRLEHGVTAEQLLDAVTRYSAYVEAGGVSSTAHVLRPETFLSAADEPWNQQWPLPEATRSDDGVGNGKRRPAKISSVERAQRATAEWAAKRGVDPASI